MISCCSLAIFAAHFSSLGTGIRISVNRLPKVSMMSCVNCFARICLFTIGVFRQAKRSQGLIHLRLEHTNPVDMALEQHRQVGFGHDRACAYQVRSVPHKQNVSAPYINLLLVLFVNHLADAVFEI